MFEKRFAAIAPQLLTSDGTVNGQITVADASLYKVKQIISLQNPSVGPQQYQVQRITNINTVFLGPLGSSNIVNDRSDVSAYTVGLGSFIFAIEQLRTSVPEQEIERLTYEEEPTVARRVILVDKMGDKFDDNNPLPVAFDGTVTIGEVEIVGPSGHLLDPNSDGSVKTVTLFNLPYDTITATYPLATQEVYQSRIGGTGGIVQQTVTVNYTDSTKNFILNAVRT